MAGAGLALWDAREAHGQPISRQQPKKKVVVVGAGIAGIAAARELSSRGFDVVLLEARTRTGGRISTDRSLGFPIDLGASWIHEHQGNPITELAEKNGIRTVVDDDSWRNYAPQAPQPDIFTPGYVHSATAKLEEALWRYAKSLTADESYGDAASRIAAADGMSAAEQMFLNFFLSRVEMSFGADSDRFSLLYGSNMDSLRGEDLLVPGGYDQIVKVLSQGLDIRTGEAAASVDWSGDNAAVTTENGSYRADAVLVSLPLGVLQKKRISFNPALPDYKQRAIERMGSGLLNKVVLHFPKVFWPSETAKFGHLSRQPGEFPEFLNWHKFSGKAVLIGFVAGAFARKLEVLPDNEVAARALAVLKEMFGAAAAEPVGCIVSRWASDPFACGSYSHIPLGATDSDYYYLGAPSGRLFFAGEATSRRFPGTVHGAFLSGLRAAGEISEKLG